jgi:hypothetical protein
MITLVWMTTKMLETGMRVETSWKKESFVTIARKMWTPRGPGVQGREGREGSWMVDASRGLNNC